MPIISYDYSNNVSYEFPEKIILLVLMNTHDECRGCSMFGKYRQHLPTAKLVQNILDLSGDTGGNRKMGQIVMRLLVSFGCEGPKPNIFMISGLLSPGEPLFMDSNIPKYFKTYRKIWKHLQTIFFISQHLGNPKCPKLLTLPDIKNAELAFSF